MTIDDAKRRLRPDDTPRFQLCDARVYVSHEGFHFIDQTDPPLPRDRQESRLTEVDVGYIERTLQANSDRFAHHLRHVASQRSLRGTRVLDIGCGGGAFLTRARDAGAICTGLEVNPLRVAYSRHRAGLDVRFETIEEFVADSAHERAFDIVTLWDVIEHVNEPFLTLECAVRALRPGGVLLVDTPARDSFYHRMGEASYRLTAGRVPLFLNSLYSGQMFGHKQIFSTAEMYRMLAQLGLEQVCISKFHELSFPVEHELERLLRSRTLSRALGPTARLIHKALPIANKMLAIGRVSDV